MKRYRIEVKEVVETMYSFIIEVDNEEDIEDVIFDIEFPFGAKCETVSDVELMLRNDDRVKRILKVHKHSTDSELDNISYSEEEEN